LLARDLRVIQLGLSGGVFVGSLFTLTSAIINNIIDNTLQSIQICILSKI